MLVARAEEKQLFLTYQRTRCRRDRDVLVERFLPLARSLARRYRRGPEPLEDLEQVASIALVNAVERFDPTRNTAFSSFAVPTITGSLKRHFRDHGWSVRVPRDLQELALRVEHITEDLAAATGTAPTAAEVADRAAISVEQVLEARQAYGALHCDSLDKPRATQDGSGQSLLDSLGSSEADIRRVFDQVALNSLLQTLDERARLIMRLYYVEELTQKQVGERLGYSQMHVSRLIRAAVEQLLLNVATQQRALGERIRLTTSGPPARRPRSGRAGLPTSPGSAGPLRRPSGGPQAG